MTIEKLQNDMNQARKDGNKFRVIVLADIIASIQKASMAGKERVEITEKLVDETLLKVKKTINEMIDTCPESRADKLYEYKAQMEIINEYAPKIITNPEEIKKWINLIMSCNGMIATPGLPKGPVMKLVMPHLRGKVDMAMANKILNDMLS